MLTAKVKSKYSASYEQKINLGPVLAINPRHVVRLHVINVGEDSWVEVWNYGNMHTTELDSIQWCEALVAEFIAANPAIAVTRQDIVAA